jgi:hypothetical protein
MSPVLPDVIDPPPYLEESRQLASQLSQLVGYDPFRDERITWTTSRRAS